MPTQDAIILLNQVLPLFPFIAIYIFGLIIFSKFHQRGFSGTSLGIISFSIFLIQMCIDLVMTYKFHLAMLQRRDLQAIANIHGIVGFITLILSLVAWALLLTSIFILLKSIKNKSATITA